MTYECLKLSKSFDLRYLEIHEEQTLVPTSYDFYLFNCHHHTMGWLDTKSIHQLPGLKLNIILEVSPGNPFALTPRREFDAYCVLDPTIEPELDVFPLPRPLEVFQQEPVPVSTGRPIIGTFGFATPGKGFERVVEAVGREFEEATVRINIPPSDYADETFFGLQNQSYAEYLANLCRAVARPGIRVETTHQYLQKQELISWCAGNTLNCFLYHRNQPGLAATTDQAISSKRPLSVSDNETFRHVHQYITPYPYRSLKESIELSGQEVLAAERDWSPSEFVKKFEAILDLKMPVFAPASQLNGADEPVKLCVKNKFQQKAYFPRLIKKLRSESTGLIGKISRESVVNTSRDNRILRPRVMFVSHAQKQCGIYQYGYNIHKALKKSEKFEFVYVECQNKKDLVKSIRSNEPTVIIYNHYPATMPWLNTKITQQFNMPQCGIVHEVTQAVVDNANQDLFDYLLCPDPTIVETKPFVFRTRRLIPSYVNSTALPKKITIGSFGFGFSDKGFERIIQTVQKEFENAKIIFQMPYNDIVDKDGKQFALATARRCRKLITRPGIDLEIRHKFLSRGKLLDFLAGNSINVFFYDVEKYKGISSTIEHALAVQRPLAINKCGMFRHVFSASPSICIEERSLNEILNQGVAPLVPFMNEWSESAFIMNYEQIMQKVLGIDSKTSTSTLINSESGV
jgi:hypothetical protein